MKIKMNKIVLLAASLLTASGAFAGKGTDIQIPLADNAVVVVEYVELLPPATYNAVYPESAENDRYLAFSKVIKEAFADAGIPATIEVVRNGSRKTGDVNLIVGMSLWELDQMGEYNCRFSGAVTNGEQEIDLGMFVGRYSQISVSTSRAREAYNKAAKKAADELVSHFFRA